MDNVESMVMNVLSNIEYGFKDDNGNNILNNEEKWENEFPQFYYLLSPEELLEKKCGVCWDQVELERKLFEDNGISVDTYFMYIDDKKQLPSHTFLTYQKNNKYYWFEHSWYPYQKIFEFNNLNDLLNDVKNKFIDSHKDDIDGNYETKIYKYNKPKYHISSDEFYQFIYTQEKIEIE